MSHSRHHRDFYSWYIAQENTGNPSKQDARRPQTRDWTDSLVANKALTKGLYHGSYPGMKFASALAFTPIAVPVWFMGVPSAKVDDDEKKQAIVDEYVSKYDRLFAQIHTQAHREGTIWIWPHYSVDLGRVVWEFIPDDVVCDIVRDLNTGEITKVISEEQLKVTSDYNKVVEAKRKRTFTAEKIEETWLAVSGTLPKDVKGATYKNPLGSMPIAFTNNQDGDEVRGHSDYERILSPLKDYHDIVLRQSSMLAKFQPKMIQTIKNFQKWMDANGWDSIHDIDITNLDLILNVEGEETKFEFPQGAHDAYESALKTRFRMIVEGSGIPEILWGTKVEGNKASAEEQMDTLVKFVEEKRSQKGKSYERLFKQTLALELGARMDALDEVKLEVEWNSLDLVSEATKAQIFSSFASGVAALVGSAGWTKRQMYALWQKMYPALSQDTYESFVKGLSEMGKLKSFSSAPYEIITDQEGYSEEELEEVPVANRRVNYSDDQPRDERVRFGEGGGSKSGGNATSKSAPDYIDNTKLSGTERNSIETYVENSDFLNSSLRENRPEEFKDDVAAIDEAFYSGGIATKDGDTFYRGAVLPEDMAANIKVGARIKDKAFMSTSYSKGVAESFATDQDFNGERFLFEITPKPSTRGLKISNADESGGEGEVLFQRYSELTVTGMTKGDSYTTIHATLSNRVWE